MNPYFIFVLALTVLYIIYYAVNIAHDLYGKKGEVKNATETYDVSDMTSNEPEPEEEDSTAVTESENGFVIGEQEVETQVDAISDATSEQEEEPAVDEADTQSKVEKLIAETSEKMEDTEVYMSDGMLDEQLYRCLLAKGMTGKENVHLEWTMTKDEM
jgi:hypothetical protein